MALKLERIEELRLAAGPEAAVAALIAYCFHSNFGARSYFQNRHHCRFLIWDGDKLVGHLAIAYRAIHLGSDRVDLIGLGEVAVSPSYRGQGLGLRLITAAIDEGRTAKADFAALFGERTLYTSVGFAPVPNAITVIEMENAHTGQIKRGPNPYFQILSLGDVKWDNTAPVDLAGFGF